MVKELSMEQLEEFAQSEVRVQEAFFAGKVNAIVTLVGSVCHEYDMDHDTLLKEVKAQVERRIEEHRARAE